MILSSFTDYRLLSILSQLDDDNSLDNKVHKITEEYGEFSQALLAWKGSPNVSKSALFDKEGNKYTQEQLEENVLEELCDIDNCVLDVMNAMGFTSDAALNMQNKKLQKWARKILEYSKDEELKEQLRSHVPMALDRYIIVVNDYDMEKSKVFESYSLDELEKWFLEEVGSIVIEEEELTCYFSDTIEHDIQVNMLKIGINGTELFKNKFRDVKLNNK